MKEFIKLSLWSFLIAIVIIIVSIVLAYTFIDSLIMMLIFSGCICFSKPIQKINLKCNKLTQLSIVFIFFCSISFFFFVAGRESILYPLIFAVIFSYVVTTLFFSKSLRKQIKIDIDIDSTMIDEFVKFSLVFLISLISFVSPAILVVVYFQFFV